MNKTLISYLETSVAQHGFEETIKKSITTTAFDEMRALDDIESIATAVLKPTGLVRLDEKLPKFGLMPNTIELIDGQQKSLDHQKKEDLEGILKKDKHQEPHHGHQPAEFELLKVLGKGGMGVVYEGLQKSLNRLVAIKKSKADLRLLAQIYHEAQITAFLDHPHILTVHDFGVDQDGFPIQVMKKIDGITWSTLLYDPKHLFWQELEIENHEDERLLFHLDVLSKVAQAVDYAHQKHVIHRDLKPENVMLGRFGEVFVLDWGIALYLGDQENLFIAQKHANLKDSLVGTPAYMAPEQVNLSIPQSTATDVYLLGAILYEIIHLQLLHQGNRIEELLFKIKENQLPPLSDRLNHELKTLLHFSFKTQPSQRPQNAKHFRKLLQQVILSFKSRQLEIKGITALTSFKQLIQVEGKLMRSMQIHQMVLTLEEQKREDAIDDCFDQARHYLKSSLELFEQNEVSKMGLQELLSLWITRCTQKHDFRQARRYLKELPIYQYHLELAITDTQHKIEKEKKEIKALKAWQDSQSVQKSQRPRVYFALFCFIFLGIGSLSIYLLSLYGKYHDSAQSRFYAAFGLTFLAVVFVEGWLYFKAKKEQLNQAFSSFKYLIYLVFIFVTLARFIGWKSHNQAELILLHEMPLIAFSTFAVGFLLKKNDFLIGGIHFSICAICAVSFPSHISLFYAIAQFVLWLSVLVTWTIAMRKSTTP